MYQIDLNDNPHFFTKQNLITLRGGGDRLKCVNCNIEGTTINITTLGVKGSYSSNKVENCVFKVEDFVEQRNGKKIKITFCSANGVVFRNLTPDSEHLVINAPPEEKENSLGVWVMGVGEPVKVLNTEFEYID